MSHFFSILKSDTPVPHLAFQGSALIPQLRHYLLSKRVHPLTNLLTQCEGCCCHPPTSTPTRPISHWWPFLFLWTDSSLPSRSSLSSCLDFRLRVFFPFSPLHLYKVYSWKLNPQEWVQQVCFALPPCIQHLLIVKSCLFVLWSPLGICPGDGGECKRQRLPSVNCVVVDRREYKESLVLKCLWAYRQLAFSYLELPSTLFS